MPNWSGEREIPGAFDRISPRAATSALICGGALAGSFTIRAAQKTWTYATCANSNANSDERDPEAADLSVHE